MAIVRFEREPDEDRQKETWEERKALLEALDEQPDPEIDYSEIPEVTDFSGWMNADEFEAYLAAKRKQATTV
jgi:hypothetical protein